MFKGVAEHRQIRGGSSQLCSNAASCLHKANSSCGHQTNCLASSSCCLSTKHYKAAPPCITKLLINKVHHSLFLCLFNSQSANLLCKVFSTGLHFES